jgi:hypothetical protein
MKLLSRINATRENGGARKFTFEISMSGVVSVGIVVVLGMCWVFILGILVGRGYKPETAVPQIAQMMPTTEAKLPEGAPSAPPSVLKPEDLQFMEDVHNQPGAEAADTTGKTPAEAKKQASAPKPHDQTEVRPLLVGGAAAAAPGRPGAALQAQPRPAAPQPPAAQAKPAEAPKVDPKTTFDKKSGPRYSATYQLASFPGKAQAETHVRDLAKKGLTASVREAKSGNTVVFRVTVQLKGSDAEISASLQKSGEKGAILLGKKPL